MHELLETTVARFPTEALHEHPPGTAVPAAACWAQTVACEDLTVNGVLGRGTPFLLSTWAGRTGLSETPPLIGTADWGAWARRVRLDRAQLRPYALAVYASTDAYIAGLPDGVIDAPRADGPACLLSALLLRLSMTVGEIASLLALKAATPNAN